MFFNCKRHRILPRCFRRELMQANWGKMATSHCDQYPRRWRRRYGATSFLWSLVSINLARCSEHGEVSFIFKVVCHTFKSCLRKALELMKVATGIELRCTCHFLQTTQAMWEQNLKSLSPSTHAWMGLRKRSDISFWPSEDDPRLLW